MFRRTAFSPRRVRETHWQIVQITQMYGKGHLELMQPSANKSLLSFKLFLTRESLPLSTGGHAGGAPLQDIGQTV